MEKEILYRQLAIDYCCTKEEAADGTHHFLLYEPKEGRRRYEEREPCFFKLAVVNGKLLCAGSEEMIAWCRSRYADASAEWFVDAKQLRELDSKLREFGYRIRQIHPFFIPMGRSDAETIERMRCLGKLSGHSEEKRMQATDGIYDIVWYQGEEIEQFRGDGRFDKAYTFDENAPDVIGVGAWKDGAVLGMAGASADSPLLWQIGINVLPEGRGRGIATLLVSLLKNRIMDEGKLPYYGTAFSHLASQTVALRSGFTPAWVELETEKIGGIRNER